MVDAAERRYRVVQLAVAITLIMVATPDARAADANNWYASLGAIYNDNIADSATDKRSSLSPTAGLGGSFTSDRERLKTVAEADLSYARYPTGVYLAGQAAPDPVTGAASLALVGSIIPERFIWDLKDSFGLAPVNLANPDTPYNRQRTNVVETGPKAMIPLGARNQLQLAASWFGSTFGVTDANGTGEKASVTLARRTSPDSTLSLQASGTRIEYSAAQSANNFDVRSVFLSWNRVRSRGELLLQLGATEIAATGGPNQHSPYMRITLTRQTSARSKFAISAGREFSSSALAFQDNQTFFGVVSNLNSIQASTAPFRSDFGRLSWLLDADRLEFNVQASARRDNYESDPLLNVRVYGIDSSIGRALSARFRLDLRADFDRKQFDAQVVRTYDRRIGADAVFTLSPALQLTGSVDHYSGSNDGTLLEYVGNTEQLRLTYRSVAH